MSYGFILILPTVISWILRYEEKDEVRQQFVNVRMTLRDWVKETETEIQHRLPPLTCLIGSVHRSDDGRHLIKECFQPAFISFIIAHKAEACLIKLSLRLGIRECQSFTN